MSLNKEHVPASLTYVNNQLVCAPVSSFIPIRLFLRMSEFREDSEFLVNLTSDINFFGFVDDIELNIKR